MTSDPTAFGVEEDDFLRETPRPIHAAHEPGERR